MQGDVLLAPRRRRQAPSQADGDGEGVVHGADDGRPRRHDPRTHSAQTLRQTHLRRLHAQAGFSYST